MKTGCNLHWTYAILAAAVIFLATLAIDGCARMQSQANAAEILEAGGHRYTIRPGKTQPTRIGEGISTPAKRLVVPEGFEYPGTVLSQGRRYSLYHFPIADQRAIVDSLTLLDAPRAFNADRRLGTGFRWATARPKSVPPGKLLFVMQLSGDMEDDAFT